MKPPLQKNRALAKVLFFVILAVVVVLIAYSAIHLTPWSWPVPEEAKQLKNPLQPSSVALNSARKIYLDKCANCHGDRGKGDGRDAARYDPQPADFPHPLLRNPAKHSASPPVRAQHRRPIVASCKPPSRFYRLLTSWRVSLWTEAGSARNLDTVGPTEMQSRLMCPHGESSVITGASIATANSCAGVGFT